jgi:hypothetical protein
MNALHRLMVAAFALTALAASATAHGAPLDFSALPNGHAAPVPLRATAPDAIAGGRLAEDIVRIVPRERNVPGYREYLFFDDALRAREYETSLRNHEPAPLASGDTCFATSAAFRIASPDDPRHSAWDSFSSESFVAQSYKGDPTTKVIPVRAERWIGAGEKARLEATLFWVDLRSGGSRLISRSESELVRVATPFAGVSVYAMRTRGDAVSFFVRRDQPPELAALMPGLHNFFGNFSGPRDPLDLVTLRAVSGEDVRSSPCAFHRLDLELRPETADEPLPARAPVKGRAKKPFFGGLTPLPQADLANVMFAVVTAFEPEKAASRDGVAMLHGTSERRGTLVARGLVVNLGLARPETGSMPVPSVSYRWLGRPVTRSFGVERGTR